MKRIILLILSLVMILSMVSCASSPDGTTDLPELGEISEILLEESTAAEKIKEKLVGRYCEDIYVSWGDSDDVIVGMWAEIWLLENEKCIALYYDNDGYVHDILVADNISDIDHYDKVKDKLDIIYVQIPVEKPECLYLVTEKYVDISALPVLDLNIQPEYTFDSRTIKLEDSIDNEIEYTLYKFFYNEIAQFWADRISMVGDNDGFSIAVKNEEKLAKEENIYIANRIIHSMEILPVDVVSSAGNSMINSIIEIISDENIEKYAIIELDTTWRHNPDVKFAPQTEDGRYLRYYLIAKPAESDSYKVYEVFWYFFE